MIVTPIRTLHIPMPYFAEVSDSSIHSSNYYAMEEIIAWLKAEGASRSGVEAGLHEDEYDFGTDIDCMLQDSNLPRPSLPVDDYFTLLTNDGKEVKEAVASLRRRFHLIDDFLSDFPNERRVGLPFPEGVVRAVVFCEKVSLSTIYDCLCHLNPKSSMCYFYFDTKGSKPERLIELAHLCKEDEVNSVIDSRKRTDLPRNGLGINFLAHILWRYDDVKNMESIFSSYPSFLTVFYMSIRDWDRFDHLVLTADYSQSMELTAMDDLYTALTENIVDAFGRISTKKEAETILSMLKADRISPYFIRPSRYISGMDYDRTRRALTNGAKLLEMEYYVLEQLLSP